MRSPILAAALALSIPAFGGGRDKPLVPPFVRTAQTVNVVIDPDAGVSPEDPRANTIAQRDVESALQNWGRYQVVIGREQADLIVVVRKGRQRLIDQTITDPRQNRRPGTTTPTDGGIGGAGQRGPQPPLSSQPPLTGPVGAGQSTTEVAPTVDSFTVYDGRIDKPLDSAPAWRYAARDGLKSPQVPAVAEFRKAVAEADRQAAAGKP